MKGILKMMAKKPGLTVFSAIRSQWGEGIDIQNAVDKHMEEMLESGHMEPEYGATIFSVLQGTRDLAEKLLPEGEFEAAFFFAHAAAAMIRRCEESEGLRMGLESEVEEWAKALDGVMKGAVKGWHGKCGKSKKGKEDAETLLELLEGGEGALRCDQAKWYPGTLKALRAWAK
jgi:hypothetical protein